jgi:hypothetical protein
MTHFIRADLRLGECGDCHQLVPITPNPRATAEVLRREDRYKMFPHVESDGELPCNAAEKPPAFIFME